MDEYIITCLVDVWNACAEIEQFFDGQPKLYETFKNDTLKLKEDVKFLLKDSPIAENL